MRRLQGPVAAVVMQLSLKYVKASLLYLVVGASMMLLSFLRIIPFDMTAFYFMQLYGFVAMMIFGLSYLFVPAFAHTFLHSLKLAKAQFWLMNIGVIALTTSFSGILPFAWNTRYLVTGSLTIQVFALYLHAYNLWRTMQAWRGSPGERLAKESAKTL